MFRIALLFGFLALPADETLLLQIAESGRCADLVRDQSPPRIAPGQPPLLSFRYYEGKAHRRFDDSGLMLDDAGH